MCVLCRAIRKKVIQRSSEKRSMNSETMVRRRPSERLERFQRTSWDLLSKAVSSVCLAVVITSRTVAGFDKLRPYIEHQFDLVIFGPVAIALQQFIGVDYGAFC